MLPRRESVNPLRGKTTNWRAGCLSGSEEGGPSQSVLPAPITSPKGLIFPSAVSENAKLAETLPKYAGPIDAHKLLSDPLLFAEIVHCHFATRHSTIVIDDHIPPHR